MVSEGSRAVGIIANPVSGKDIRRLVANAPTSTIQEKYTIVRRLVLGAAETGVDQFWFLSEPHHICDRAVETLDLACRYDAVPIEARYDESDTVRTVTAMAELGVGAVVVLGGDGTNRAAAIGWQDAPLVSISTGTNNVFPRFVEATVAGQAAGLVATGQVALGQVSRRAKIIHVEIADEEDDLALIDAVLVDERFVGSRALFAPEALRVAVLTRAEPASVGISSIGGLVLPCGAEDEAGVLVRFADLGAAHTRLRAPLAPGWYAEVGIGDCVRLGPDEPIEIVGPGVLAFDGERQRLLGRGQRATLRVTRTGPFVIDVDAAMRIAAQRRLFVAGGH
ncbi:MAG: NAD(+)/NADH kinase [Acidimicrobiia bacterium]|nr:NAD(+)/NADH kinase [Acidimicrobiia bacterium]